MLLGRGAGNPLLRGGCGFWPLRGCRNHMNNLVAAAFELVENFGQREDGAGVNVRFGSKAAKMIEPMRRLMSALLRKRTN